MKLLEKELQPEYFSSPSAFREWLKENHNKKSELLAGFYKVGSGKPSMTWSESVDQALCFGWIDGVRKSVDKDRYTIRFTPRKQNSIWSQINIKKIDALKKAGLLEPSGLSAFEKRNPLKEKLYSYEKKESNFSPALLKRFRSNKKASKFFIAQPPGYQKLIIHWVMDAKQEETRVKRLEKLILSSVAGKKL